MARDAGLAFAQNLVDSFTRFKILQFQLEKEDRRERRYERQLQQNQRHFDIREERLTSATESLIQQRQSPQRGTKEWALKQGYSDKASQLYQDRYNKLAPPLATPYQRAIAARIMMDNAQTDEMYDAGDLILKEAMDDLKNQATFPSRDGATEPTESGTSPTAFPSEIELQGSLPPEPDAGISFERLGETKTRNRAELLAEYHRLGGSKSAEARKFAEDNGLLD